MRVRFSVSAVLLACIALSGIAMSDAAEQKTKARTKDFIVAGSDGYGTQECLAGRGSCGRIVADAWCESKGFKSALAYRQLDADEITGSTGTSRNAKPVESFLISCKD